MTTVALLTGSWSPSIEARVIRVADALHGAGAAVTVIAPVSPTGTGLCDGVGLIPARRADDATRALRALASEPALVIECFDAAAVACASAWRDGSCPRVPVLVDAGVVPGNGSVAGLADGALAWGEPHERWCLGAGFAPERVLRAPCPIAPRAPFVPGSEAILCLTPIGPDRCLVEMIDAWAASGCGTNGPWTLRFGGPIEDAGFARSLVKRAAGCPGVGLTERLNQVENEIAASAVLIDPEGSACPIVLDAAARGRAVFAPAGSPTASAVGGGPAGRSAMGFDTDHPVRGLISVFDRLLGVLAADFNEPGQVARERVLRQHAVSVAVAARREAHARALALRADGSVGAGPAHVAGAPARWGWASRSRQNPDHTARLERAMLACHAAGLRRVALYGAGEFVKGCADALCEPPLEIVGFMDDDPAKRSRRVWGYPVLCPDVALTADLDAVILTAPSCEEQLWQRTAWFREARIHVIPLTREYAELFASRAA